MVQIEEDVQEKVKSLLKELFQFDNQDLDFGIYRIMNFKRKEIQKFIEQDLIAEAEKQFKEYSLVGQADLKNEVETLKQEIIRDFGEGTLDDQGNVKKNYDAPKIKQYLSKIKSLEDTKVTQSQISDVFNHIYEFFSRYYDKGDFIPKRRYGGKSKYYVPYNGEEVALYWATKDMYYIKTGEFFKKYSFRAGVYTVTFVLTEAKVEVGNVKGEKKFFMLSPDNPVTVDNAAKLVEIRFNYRGLLEEEISKYGKLDVQAFLVNSAIEEIEPFLKGTSNEGMLKSRAEGEKSLLKKHIDNYVERNSRDFFIHKDLKGFLERELDFYLKNEVWSLGDLETVDDKGANLLKAKARAIHNIAGKIVEFLDQIESFQRKLFEKKKLVLQTDYCITLDLVSDVFYDEIGRNEDQVAEWKELFSLDEITKNTFEDTREKKTLSPAFLKLHKTLVIDTKHFGIEFKDKLLSSFDNLDETIDGLVIKSENFQALNLLSSKYKGKIKCVYIDPPYNTGSDEFVYKDSYQHSSWLSMMMDRLALAKLEMNRDGLIFISIDENEIHYLKCLMENIFGSNLEAIITWRRRHNQPNDATKMIAKVAENILIYSRDSEYLKQTEAFSGIPLSEKRALQYKNPDNDPRGPWESKPWKAGSGQSGSKYRIISPTGKILDEEWLGAEETYKRFLKEQIIYFPKHGDGLPRKKYYLNQRQEEGQSPHNFWNHEEFGSNQEASSELEDLFGRSNVYSNPKPSRLINSIVQISSYDSDTVLDFFAGSGTTGHSIIKLNSANEKHRKFILIEMGEYFDTILVPRLKKVVFSNEWKKGVPVSKNGSSCMIKCLRLEQYEDTLDNIILMESDKTFQETLSGFGDYFINYMLDYETRGSPTRIMLEKFQMPFNYRIKTISGIQEKELTVDLLETFNYLLGLRINGLKVFHDGGRIYRVVFGERQNENVIIIWRNIEQLDLQRDKGFIEDNIISGKYYDHIFVNGDNYVKNAQPIEPEFKRLMGA